MAIDFSFFWDIILLTRVSNTSYHDITVKGLR
jgi:hypothetical protein